MLQNEIIDVLTNGMESPMKETMLESSFALQFSTNKRSDHVQLNTKFGITLKYFFASDSHDWMMTKSTYDALRVTQRISTTVDRMQPLSL